MIVFTLWCLLLYSHLSFLWYYINGLQFSYTYYNYLYYNSSRNLFNIVDTFAILVCKSNAKNIDYGWVCRVNITHIIICLNAVCSKWDNNVRCFRTPDSLRWPFAIGFRPSSSVVVRPVLTIKRFYLLFKTLQGPFCSN